MLSRLCAACGLAGLAVLAGPPGAAAATVRVDIAKLAFAPAQVSAHVGDTIEWANSDFIVHTATASDKAWDITIPAKGTASVTLTKPGVIDYYCRFHPNMKGQITVEAGAPPAGSK